MKNNVFDPKAWHEPAWSRRSGVVLSLLVSAVVMIGSPAFAAGLQADWTLGFGNSGSADLLRELTEKADIDTSGAEPVAVVEPDGPMPEIATQHIPVKSAVDAVIPALKQACGALGLTAPDADLSAAEPHAICTGTYKTSKVNVVATVTSQNADTPILSLETRAIDH